MKTGTCSRRWRTAARAVLVAACAVASVRGGPRIEGASADRVRSRTARQVIGPETHLQSLVAGAGATMTISLTPAFSYPGGTYNTEGLYTDANINGQTLIIPAGGGTSYWEIKLTNWDPSADCPDPGNGCGSPTLRNWQARPDASGWYSGDGDPLDNGAFGCSNSSQCVNAARLGSPGSVCSAGTCQYAFINSSATRIDQFRPEDKLSCDAPTWDVGQGFPNDPAGTEIGPLFFGGNDFGCGIVDRHTSVYGGTMALTVPEGAHGAYTLGFVDAETFATDANLQLILLANEVPGILKVSTAPCCFCNGRCEDVVAETCAFLGGRAGVIGQTCGQAPCAPGDMVGDGVIDLADWTVFEPCILGPLGPAADDCSCADLSHDGNVDLEDVAMFWAAFGFGQP